MSELINVGIAECSKAKSPNVLRTILGSCVGICLYDKSKQVGALAHIMLPVKKKAESSDMKYADTAIPLILNKLKKEGSVVQNIEAKIIGGASMFKLSPNSKMAEIGINNISKSKEVLANLNIKLVAEDVGGDFGRTLDFFMENGEVHIRSIGKDEKVI